jgi:phage tail-like protein
MSQDRRNFLKHVGTGAAAAVAVTKITEQVAPAAESSTFAVLSPARSSAQVKIALELDKVVVGWVESVEGGTATADIVIEKVGEDGIARKHIAGVKYEDITVNCGTGMSKAFYQWIQDSFDHKFPRKDGSITVMDFNYNARTVREFSNAIISEVTFPALDAGSKDAAKMTIKFSPEVTHYKKGSGKFSGNLPVNTKQKAWLPSNFRLKIDGLDGATARVNKIDSITIKQNVARNPVGDDKDVTLEPTSLEFPNLKVSLAEAHADEFAAWHEDFVIKGNNGQEKEKTGSLEFLDATQSQVLFTLNLKNLGIFKFDPEEVSANQNERIPQVKVEMYVEEIKFTPPDPNKPTT